VAGRVERGELELAELELVTIQQVAVGRAQELLGVGAMPATWPGWQWVATIQRTVTPFSCSAILSAGRPGSMTTASFVEASEMT